MISLSILIISFGLPPRRTSHRFGVTCVSIKVKLSDTGFNLHVGIRIVPKIARFMWSACCYVSLPRGSHVVGNIAWIKSTLGSMQYHAHERSRWRRTQCAVAGTVHVRSIVSCKSPPWEPCTCNISWIDNTVGRMQKKQVFILFGMRCMQKWTS